MRARPVLLCVVFLLASGSLAGQQTAGNANDPSSKTISLNVDAGVPLRVYLTKRLSKRLNEPVHAKLLDPVFAFDREVIPAGTEVLGRVSRLDPMSKMSRATAILAGDFTPLHRAHVEFTTIVLPDGRQIAVHTGLTPGLNSIFSPTPPKKKTKPRGPRDPAVNGGVLGTGKQQLKTQIDQRINGQTRGVADIVRGPDKRERLQEFLLAKLPYHPQWVRKGTRFDAELREPVQFGSVTVKTETLQLLGSEPPRDSLVHARLVTRLNSGSSKLGETVQAVISQPLFSSDKRLILPEGTHLIGAVTLAHRVRWFHRGGQLRFNFQKIDLPAGLAAPAQDGEKVSETKTQASLAAAESGGQTAIKVDGEGGVKAVEPKTRLIAPAISVLIATKSLDNDAEHRGGGDANVGGRTMGGASGLGLLGAAAAQASRTVGSALGFYGMAWSVYTNIIARGGEVEFGDNTAVDIRFGARAPAATSKFRQVAANLAGNGAF